MPTTAKDIIEAFKDPQIFEKYALNLRKSKNFYVDTIEIDSIKCFTLFVSYEVIELIETYIAPEYRYYLMDGTFAVVPIGNFYQLLIIHIEFKNDVCSLLFVP